MSSNLVDKSDLALPLFIRGKVRDSYDLGERLLVIATDRISAFDVVLPNPIPDKGKVLNQISLFWFKKTENIVANHVIEPVYEVSSLDKYIPEKKRFAYPSYLSGRSMVVKKAHRIPVECVVRGYISGSAWVDYQNIGSVCGLVLPHGLRESQELPEPLFTPTTKAETGHDRPLNMEEMRMLVGSTLAEEMREISLEVYKFARKYAREKGIIIADTKMEFGMEGGKLILIDELLTPDSSRFWDTAAFKPGQSQPSYDKQPVRDWLVAHGWNREPPAPKLPPEIVKETTERYRTAFEKLTGEKLR